MTAWDIFALLAGGGILVLGIGVAVFLVSKSREVHLTIENSDDAAKIAEAFINRAPRRYVPEYSRWTYKTTTTFPRESTPLVQAEKDAVNRLEKRTEDLEKKRSGRIQTAPPAPEHTSPSKEK